MILIYDRIVVETVLAWILEFGDETVSIPKSQGKLDEGDNTVEVPMWLVHKKGLESYEYE